MSDTPGTPGSPHDGPPSVAGVQAMLGGLSDYDVLEMVASYSTAIATAEACRMLAIRELACRPCMLPLPVGDLGGASGRTHKTREALSAAEVTQAELTARLCISDYDAARLIDAARGLVTRLPGTLTALLAGRLDLRRAIMIHEHIGPLANDHYDAAMSRGASPWEAEKAAADVARRVEEEVLRWADTQSPRTLTRTLSRVIKKTDPGFTERHRRNHLASRNVSHRTNPADGTGDIYAHLGAVEALASYNTIDAYARLARSHGDPRTLDELRADALVHLILHGHLPASDADGTDDTQTSEGRCADVTVIPDGTQLRDRTGTHEHDDCCDTQQHHDCEPSAEADIDDADAAGKADHADDADDADAGFVGGADLAGEADDCASSASHTFSPCSDSAPAATSSDVGGEPTIDHIPAPQAPTHHAPARTQDDDTTTSHRAGGDGSPAKTTPPDGTLEHSASRPGSNASGSGSDTMAQSSIRAHVYVTVALETLLGLDDHPADLRGHGPITADLARDLAFGAGSSWRRLVTDALTGTLLDYGRTIYRPPVPLADHTRARDVACRTNNCDLPAAQCDLDHLLRYPAGATNDINLHAKCRRHHRLKHEGRWVHRLSTDPNHPAGTIIITSPTGHTYLSHRPNLRPDHTPSNPTASTADANPKEAIDEPLSPDGPSTKGHRATPAPDPGPPPPF